jgi:hypothetical protein
MLPRTPPGQLGEYLFGDLGVAVRHLNRLPREDTITATIYDDIFASIQRAMDRIMRDMQPEAVDFRTYYETWPHDKKFPLTPLEAWYIMKGHAVRPKKQVDEFLKLPGQLECVDGYIMLKQT